MQYYVHSKLEPSSTYISKKQILLDENMNREDFNFECE